jgi:hypothetical protein
MMDLHPENVNVCGSVVTALNFQPLSAVEVFIGKDSRLATYSGTLGHFEVECAPGSGVTFRICRTQASFIDSSQLR